MPRYQKFPLGVARLCCWVRTQPRYREEEEKGPNSEGWRWSRSPNQEAVPASLVLSESPSQDQEPLLSSWAVWIPKTLCPEAGAVVVTGLKKG